MRILAPICVGILALLLAAGANAASGEKCEVADATHYTNVPLYHDCRMLCDAIDDTDNETSCGPITFPTQEGAVDVVFAIEKAQASCEPGTILIQESSSAITADPNVWTTVCSLTGVVSPLVSSCSLGRPPKGNLRATLSAITDADCTDVDVTAVLVKTLDPRPD